MVKNSRKKGALKKYAPTKTRALSKRRKSVNWLLLITTLGLVAGALHYLRTHPNTPPLPAPPADAVYKRADQPIEARLDDLMRYMTLEEKISQMALVDKNSLKRITDISTYNLGGILSGAGSKPRDNTPEGWLEMVSNIKYQAASSRLGIPLLYGIDANHGHGNVPGSTVFPHAIGLGASGDPELVRSVAAATAKEIKATGINWSYSPSLDAPLDIRWGRVYEAFSDNPALNASLGAAFVEGTQYNEKDTEELNILATAKHFLGTGSMEWGKSRNKRFKIDQGVIPADEALLDSHYLPPFKAASDAGAASVMVGLNFWGEGRVISNRQLVTEKLKYELGFKGFVVSDWYGMYEFSGISKYQANIETINAGVDMAMLPFDYKAFIKDVKMAVNQGSISEARIDDAVRRILYQKFKTGLFDLEESDTPTLDNVGSKEHRQLGRRAVAESSVLLKNQDMLLPLSKQSGRILIAGSAADNIGRQCGAWTVEWQGIDGNWLKGATSILQGIREVAGQSSDIEYEKDADFDARRPKADVGVAVVGEKPYAEGWGDNPNPTLDEADRQVIERLRTVSKKVVIVVISGRPLLMSEQIRRADAVVAAWLPGSEGAGLADVLFGNQPFKAKLPLAWPAGLNQIPLSPGGLTADKSQPLFARGHGL